MGCGSMSDYFSQFSKYNLPVFEHGVRLPEIKIPDEDKLALGLKADASNTDYLKKLCWNECKIKLANGEIKQSERECIDRLKTEFAVFEKTGVVDYLLLLRDIFGWCDKPENDIPRGSGRGSAAGSLSLYLIGLTKVNPLDHKLSFARFLSQARAKPHYIDGIMYLDGKTMADFDGDISFLGRDKVIKRLEKDYHGKVCKIATSQYLTGKMALKDTLKSGFSYHDSDARTVTDLIESVFGKVKSLKDAYDSTPAFRDWADKNPNPFKIAQKIEGLYRTKGIHASGVLISYAPVDTMMPMELSDSEEIVSGYDMDTALTMFVKGDLLGLRTLDVVEEAAKVAGVEVDDIDINDPSIYNFFQTETQFYGLFQIEDGLTRQVTIKVKPKNIDQLAACLSISRPGALKQIPDYVKFVETGEFKKVYPAIDEILLSTGNILLYQEQVSRIVMEIYGIDPEAAEDVRRCIGKKDKVEMAKWEPILYAEGEKRGVPKEITKWFWDTCNASADYLFNQSHCYSYGYITAQTVYFKANHPLAFYLACLKLAQYETDPMVCIGNIQKEMHEKGYRLMSPNIYESSDDYSIAGNDIRMGLSSIKGLSDRALEKLHSFDCRGKNKFQLFAAAKEAKIPINILVALIMSGCLPPENGESRSKLVLEAETYGLLTDKEKPLIERLGPDYKFDLLTIIKDCVVKLKDDKGKPLIKESRFETIKRDYQDYKAKFQRNTKHELLCSYIMESEYLGFSYSATLKQIYSPYCQDLMTISEINSVLPDPKQPYGEKVRVACRVMEVENRVSREKKKPYLKITVKDDTGIMAAMLFGYDNIDEATKFNGREVREDDIIILNAAKKGDALFVNSISIQDNPIVIKRADLKKEA
jgi:DNA polymerase-3 subunit alpha